MYIMQPWGFENSQTPNHDSLAAMIGKLANQTGYDPRGPGQYFTDPTSGATDDWAYGVLGAAGMTWEVGNTFNQDCDTFERDICLKNLPALTYAAKLAHRLYSLSKGPDVMQLEVNPSEIYPTDAITVDVQASDNAIISDGVYATASQDVDEIRIYFDRHPYSDDASFPDRVLDNTEISSSGEGKLTLEWDAISELLKGSQVGRHVIYVEAVDSDGYVGPISSVAFTVQGYPTYSPSQSTDPSSGPSPELSESPSEHPSQTSSMIPTSKPSSNPTSKPSWKPSCQASLEPSRSPQPSADDNIGRSTIFCDAVSIYIYKLSTHTWMLRWCFYQLADKSFINTEDISSANSHFAILLTFAASVLFTTLLLLNLQL
jgi:hypothetical protein